jgi:hypothetical protein
MGMNRGGAPQLAARSFTSKLNHEKEKEKKMKKLLVTITSVILALAAIVSMMLPLHAQPESSPTGGIAAGINGESSNNCCGCAGRVELMPDGSLQGEWSWTYGLYRYYQFEFEAKKLISLSFPRNNIAVLSGFFDCRFYSFPDTISKDDLPYYLTFIVITDQDTPGAGKDTLIVNGLNDIPVQLEGGRFHVNAANLKQGAP